MAVTLNDGQARALKQLLKRHIPVLNRMADSQTSSVFTKFEASYYVDIANDILETINAEEAKHETPCDTHARR